MFELLFFSLLNLTEYIHTFCLLYFTGCFEYFSSHEKCIKFIFSGRRRLKDSQITACLTRGEDLLLFSVYIIINWLSLSFWLLTRQNKTSEENPNHDLPDKRSTVILKGFSALLQEKRRVEKSWGPGHFPWCVCIMEETELSPIINVHRKEIRSHT